MGPISVCNRCNLPLSTRLSSSSNVMVTYRKRICTDAYESDQHRPNSNLLLMAEFLTILKFIEKKKLFIKIHDAKYTVRFIFFTPKYLSNFTEFLNP